MEKYILDAKERAKDEAERFIEKMCLVARDIDVDDEWFLEEVKKNIKLTKEK